MGGTARSFSNFECYSQYLMAGIPEEGRTRTKKTEERVNRLNQAKKEQFREEERGNAREWGSLGVIFARNASTELRASRFVARMIRILNGTTRRAMADRWKKRQMRSGENGRREDRAREIPQPRPQ